MKAHIVLAHPEPNSYNAHLAEAARQTLEGIGWEVSLSDLYAMGFDPCERAEHYTNRQNLERFDAQSEQHHAAGTGTIPKEISDEIARLDEAELVILQYPMWWHLPPAILKGWFDRVLVYGEVYRSKQRFETGRFVGKRAIQSVTVGTSPETYAFDGRSADIDMLLWPVNFTLTYVGFDILKPQVTYGVEGGLRYSDPAVIEDRLRLAAENYSARLRTLDSEACIPFNRMSEWGEDGRLKPDAPVHSPFIRRVERLIIE